MNNFKVDDTVVCRDQRSVEAELTHNAMYKVLKVEDSWLTVENDLGQVRGYSIYRFFSPTSGSNTPDVITKTASKNDQNKPDLSLVPRVALEAAAKAFMVGEKKYGRYNYYKGHKVTKLIAALLRHATSYNEGEEFDPVDGQPHLGSVIATASMILRQAELGTLIDDRYKEEEESK